MNTAVVRAGTVKLPVCQLNLELRTTGSVEMAWMGCRISHWCLKAASLKVCACGVAFTSTTACEAGKYYLAGLVMRSTMSPGVWFGPTLKKLTDFLMSSAERSRKSPLVLRISSISSRWR